MTKANRRFCNVKCKNEYHQHGSAFGPLKHRLEKLVVKLAGQAMSKEAMMRSGFIHRSQLRKKPADQRAEELRDDITRLQGGLAALALIPTEHRPASLRRSIEILTGLIKALDQRLQLVETALTVLAKAPALQPRPARLQPGPRLQKAAVSRAHKRPASKKRS